MERVALLYDVCAKIGWRVGLLGTSEIHCALNSSHGGEDGLSITEWVQVQKRTSHVFGMIVYLQWEVLER